jgi:hypothetical protein
MKKQQLMDLLVAIEGDPDILLWDSARGNWQDIAPVITGSTLVRETLDHYTDMYRMELCLDQQNTNAQISDDDLKELKSDYCKHVVWEHDHQVSQERIDRGYYQQKAVAFINAVREK